MLKRSFQLFLIEPLSDLWKGLASYLIFIYQYAIDFILIRNISDVSSENILQQAFKFFKIQIFIIVVNISINEIFLDKDSNLIHEFNSEIAYLSFFYISFLVYYYISALYIRFTSNIIHRVLVIRTWLMLIFILTIIFQLTGALNPDKLSEKIFLDLLSKDMLVVYLIFLLIKIYHVFKLIKRNQIKWYDSLFYIIIFASYLFLIIIKSIIIQKLLS